MKNSIQLMVFLITAILFAFSCNDSGVNPEDNLKPGRRDYVWTSDSLVHHNVGLGEIWGASPNDVWACGNAWDAEFTLWHFNGNHWEPYVVPGLQSPYCIYGFSNNDIWIGTLFNEIWHYDGVDWQKNAINSIPGYRLLFVELYGIAPDDIFALGYADKPGDYFGIIYHYNGIEWKHLNISKTSVSFSGMTYIKEENKYLLRANNMDGNNPERLYKLDGLSLMELYAGDNLVYVSQIELIPYIAIGNKVYHYSKNELLFSHDFSSTTFASGLFGKNKKDIFTANNDGIGHFNGEDLITIYPHNVYTVDGILFEKDVFFLITSGTSTNIVHGKLSEVAE